MKTLEKNLLSLKAIIMAGGKGSRLGNPYKPFIEICGKPMILWVYDVVKKLVNQRNIYVSTLRNHPILPLLKEVMDSGNIIFTSGKGYEYDVLEALRLVGLPSIVLPSDTPFISIDDLLELVNSCQTSICNLVSNGKFVGISFWKSFDFDKYSNIESRRNIINVNTKDELEIVNNMCREGVV